MVAIADRSSSCRSGNRAQTERENYVAIGVLGELALIVGLSGGTLQAEPHRSPGGDGGLRFVMLLGLIMSVLLTEA